MRGLNNIFEILKEKTDGIIEKNRVIKAIKIKIYFLCFHTDHSFPFKKKNSIKIIINGNVITISLVNIPNNAAIKENKK